jgi:hypothetical protein
VAGALAELHAYSAREAASLDLSTKAITNLGLAAANAERVDAAIRSMAAEDGVRDVGVRVLRELVARDLGVAMELLDAEGRLACLLAKGVIDPAPFAAAATMMRDVAGSGEAIRQRMARTLEAAAALDAKSNGKPAAASSDKKNA